MKTVSFHTLGCRLNQAETATLENDFAANGYAVEDGGNKTDVVVINTCTVTANGDADTRKLVNRINRENPNAEIALIGCQAQVQGKKLADMENVRWVVGNGRKMQLASIISDDDGTGETAVLTQPIKAEPFTMPTAAVDRQHTRANIKVQDGCDFFCLFCEIPYARGRARSRVLSDIEEEANALVGAGHHELVITGVNIGTYSYEQHDVLDVIDTLCAVPGIGRVRIGSIEPTTIPEALFDRMTPDSPLCRYLHIPIQSGSDAILEAMNRKYTLAEYTDFLRLAEERVPDVCFGTDVIVGYPGETDALFQETEATLRELPFAYFHVFSYSQRDHARSRKLPDDVVPKPVIKERSRILRELSGRKRHMYYERFRSTTMPVLMEQQKDGVWTGMTENFIRVKAADERHLANQFVDVRLERVDGPTMIGEII
jgi:threonylcarbamoyladenosine tRNA methylthiotransferase MtaB